MLKNPRFNANLNLAIDLEPLLVIIPCGGKKRPEPCRAEQMYTGPYHRACRRLALLWAPRDRVLILSARYGLLRLDDWIEPYELRMGRPGCVGEGIVRAQAGRMGLLGSRRVIALGGFSYTNICRQVWPGAAVPLSGVGGIGKQLRWLNHAIGKFH